MSKIMSDARPVAIPKVAPPIVCLPLMTRPARDVEKGIKYLPEVWRSNA